MALFRSKKQQVQTQIPELQDYYATQKKESTAMAWLLAIGSLLVTVAIFIGLFLGGRWLYRSVTNNDDKSTNTTQTENKPANSGSSSTSTTQPNPNESANINSGTVTVNNSGSSSTTSSSGSSSTTSSSTAPGVSPNQSESTNSSATAANTSLPNSGPGGIAVIFVLTTIAGTILYRRLLLSQR